MIALIGIPVCLIVMPRKMGMIVSVE